MKTKGQQSQILRNVQELDKVAFETILSVYAESYHNGEPEIDDDTYDSLVDMFEKKFSSKHKDVGAPVPDTRFKITLPKFMGSLDKVKTQKELDLWVDRMKKLGYKIPKKNAFVVSDKMDGISMLHSSKKTKIGEKLCTRGDGSVGSDVSHLLKYLNLEIPSKFNGTVRGEIYIPKKVFQEEFSEEFSNPRNMVSGIINPMTKKYHTEGLKSIRFRAYEYDDFDKSKLSSPEEQFDFFSDETNYSIPKLCFVDTLNVDKLTKLLKERREEAEYEMDGLVIQLNVPTEKSSKMENPDTAVAFKIKGESVEVKVEGVEWEQSRHGLLKPKIRIETVNLCGVNITYATGFNAKFIYDNNIGKGSIVRITRSGDVIPYVEEVVKSTVTDEPDESVFGQYEWNDSRVELVVVEKENDTHKIKAIHSW